MFFQFPQTKHCDLHVLFGWQTSFQNTVSCCSVFHFFVFAFKTPLHICRFFFKYLFNKSVQNTVLLYLFLKQCFQYSEVPNPLKASFFSFQYSKPEHPRIVQNQPKNHLIRSPVQNALRGPPATATATLTNVIEHLSG